MQLNAIISGKVQKVGFRYFTREKALKLGLKGTVQNLIDGTVQLRVIGNKEKIEELIDYLKVQFSLADSSFDLIYTQSEDTFSSFEILK